MTGSQLSQCSAYITDDTEVGRLVRRSEPGGGGKGGKTRRSKTSVLIIED